MQALDQGVLARWRFRAPADGAIAGRPLVERVLASRGVVEREAVERFTNPTLHLLHDASLLPGVEQAAARLLASLERGGPVVIYGDYDVDGITAAAIVTDGVAQAMMCPLGARPLHDIPHGDELVAVGRDGRLVDRASFVSEGHHGPGSDRGLPRHALFAKSNNQKEHCGGKPDQIR